MGRRMMGPLTSLAPSSWNLQGGYTFSPAISGRKRRYGVPGPVTLITRKTLGPYNGINFLLEFISVSQSATLLPLGSYSGSSLQLNFLVNI